MAGPGPRRQAREAALQVLFAADVSQKLPAQAFEDVALYFSLPTRARARARDLVLGVSRNLAQVDTIIGQSAEHWKVSRLATVDRNILRIATYELLFEPVVPTEVILDEAIEIARRFAGETSRVFVNGVLDVIAREVRGAAA